MGNFHWQTTADEVLEGIDLTGKRVLITGVSAGLGVETARTFVAHGAEVVGTARDLEKARGATAHIRAEHSERLSLVELDLASLASVRAASDFISAEHEPFDLVIANAGVMATPFGRTVDGFEMQFGTNHLGHFLLLNRLAGLVRTGGRVITLASTGHQFADVELNDPNFELREYDPLIAYGGSKTANILFAVEFDRRHKQRGVRAAAVHPGGIMTELVRYMTPELFQRMIAIVSVGTGAEVARRLKSVPQGAATTVWAAVVAPADQVGGRYCADCEVLEAAESGPGVRRYAVDAERAKQLWTKSEQLVGERFPE